MKIFILILLPILLFAQLNYSGSITPTYLMHISDGTDISLPFRLADLQLGYSFGDFELKTNTALEVRWQGSEVDIDLREAFIIWYPDFGEVKLGKMIHTWGAADGNNPTDNLNPYDYYYMFLPGADRKIGVLSGSVKTYWEYLSLEGIFIPEYTTNRLPFGEEDFPIQFPFEPEEYIKNENEYEFGVRLQSTFNWADISITYFNGYDDLFSIQYFTPTGQLMNPFIPNFGFRKTEMYGTDFVTFVDDFTIRGEVAYFDTKDKLDEFVGNVYFDVDANYLQYLLQFEYAGLSDINLGVQYLGTSVVDANGTYFTGMGTEDLTKDNFKPGMGTPFAMIAEKALIVNGSTSIFDSRLDLEAMTLINLDETGYLFGINADYSPFENWKLKLGISKFFGDSDDPENRFTQMEDFSHISLGLEFNF